MSGWRERWTAAELAALDARMIDSLCRRSRGRHFSQRDEECANGCESGGLSQWLRRLADFIDGDRPPDARDQELKDAGTVLEWRLGIRRREHAAGRL